jgi:hypothetical protein
MRLKRKARQAVPGSSPGANGALGSVLAVGARPRQSNPFPGVITPNGRPPGDPTRGSYSVG